ncbi:MAG: NAD(P)H-dependent oxidoreductase subunit E [Myxococcota bacterium]|jgi:NADH:ubiquinone oxidoreductase subunit E|nr:NAD(P)H-dependent oxidoreductase subunit E [Myxococcota bacterium]
MHTSHGIEKMRAAHHILAALDFTPAALERGYAGRTLRIDLSSKSIEIRPVSQQMKELWTGGKGFDLWLMFQEIDKDTKWDSPNNPICMSSGPLGGTTSFPGSGKTLVTSLSPSTHSVMDCNVGGYFGPYLKFAGFDALTIVGKATEETVVCIDAVAGKVTIETAPLESIDAHLVCEELTEMYAQSDWDRRNIAVVAAGKAAEHAYMGVLNFSFWDWRRRVTRLKQAGRGGIGTVFRNKNIKALVLRNRDYTPSWSVAPSKAASLIELPASSGCCGCPKSTKDDVQQVVAKWHHKPEYVIEMMQDIQEKHRHISREALDALSHATGVSRGHLYHIATFYKAFSLTPRGENVLQVCLGTACHVKGSVNILEAFERELHIRRGQTTKDQKWSLEPVACLGACSIAPVVKIGEEVLGNLQSKDVEKVIKDFSRNAR